jgi:hypothetical protein
MDWPPLEENAVLCCAVLCCAALYCAHSPPGLAYVLYQAHVGLLLHGYKHMPTQRYAARSLLLLGVVNTYSQHACSTEPADDITDLAAVPGCSAAVHQVAVLRCTLLAGRPYRDGYHLRSPASPAPATAPTAPATAAVLAPRGERYSAAVANPAQQQHIHSR